jgi:hypothetical protein
VLIELASDFDWCNRCSGSGLGESGGGQRPDDALQNLFGGRQAIGDVINRSARSVADVLALVMFLVDTWNARLPRASSTSFSISLRTTLSTQLLAPSQSLTPAQIPHIPSLDHDV